MQRSFWNATHRFAKDERIVNFPEWNKLHGLGQFAMQFLQAGDGRCPIGNAVVIDQALPQPVRQIADGLDACDVIE